jgi:uncharacterized Zn finger protein
LEETAMADNAGKTSTPPKNAWAQLTWDDLNAWAGPRSLARGRNYQRTHHVRDLAVSADGKLLAWVRGTERYATQVELRPEEAGEAKLASVCTCPVGHSGCKHAVAVVLQYLQALKDKTPVPTAAAKDPRRSLLARTAQEAELEDDEDFEEEEAFGDAEFDEEEEHAATQRWHANRAEVSHASAKGKKAKGNKEGSLRAYLEGLPAGELVNLVLRFAEDHPEIAEGLSERMALAAGKTGELLRQARKEMTRVTGERGDWDDWHGGFVADYSGLQRRLKDLLELGQADAVIELGRELFQRGVEQVEQSQDEGETAGQLIDCLEVIFHAVLRSSLSGPRKLLYVIDLCLDDDYDLCQSADVVLDAEWPAADWSAVADDLARRLEGAPAPQGDASFHDRYNRDGLSYWLIQALEAAGREDEALAVMEAEAPKTGSYVRLVERLIRDGQLDDAVRWAMEGIEHTRNQMPGIASQLQTLVRQVAEQRKDWPTVAALYAEEFFQHPSVATLRQLQKAAGKAGCAEQVNAAALHFLETGVRPQPAPAAAPVRKGRAAGRSTPATAAQAPTWPLPAPLPAAGPSAKEAGKARTRALPARQPSPHYDILLDLAIDEKRPDDVLAWYDRVRPSHRSQGFGVYAFDHNASRVADAVAATHPERALELYRGLAEREIAATTPSAYERAMPHLRKIRAVLHRAGRKADWEKYVAELRADNHRKRRFLEMLDSLEGRPIIEG